MGRAIWLAAWLAVIALIVMAVAASASARPNPITEYMKVKPNPITEYGVARPLPGPTTYGPKGGSSKAA